MKAMAMTLGLAVVLVTAAGANAGNLYWVDGSTAMNPASNQWSATEGGAAGLWVAGSDAIFPDSQDLPSSGSGSYVMNSITLDKGHGWKSFADGVSISLGAGGLTDNGGGSSNGIRVKPDFTLTANQVWAITTNNIIQPRDGSIALSSADVQFTGYAGYSRWLEFRETITGTGNVTVGDGVGNLELRRSSGNLLGMTGDVTVKNLGILNLNNNAETLDGDLYLETGGIYSNNGNTLNVDHLYIDGVPQDAGIYGSGDLPGLIRDGSIEVAEGPPAGAPIPEPATAMLLVLGLGGIGLRLRRRR
jgi:hypothetical protein